MNCNEVREWMSLYIDHMLDEEQMDSMKNHLDTCDACRCELNELRNIAQLLQEVPDLPVPEEFDQLLRRAIQSEKKAIKRGHQQQKWIRYTSLAAVFAIGIFSVLHFQGQIPTEPVPAILSGPEATVMMTQDASEEAVSMTKDASEEAVSPKQDAPEEAVTMMRIAPVEVDDGMQVYITQLDELFPDGTYTLVEWTLESSEVYLITIDVTTTNEDGTVSSDRVNYRAKEGELWKIE